MNVEPVAKRWSWRGRGRLVARSAATSGGLEPIDDLERCPRRRRRVHLTSRHIWKEKKNIYYTVIEAAFIYCKFVSPLKGWTFEPFWSKQNISSVQSMQKISQHSGRKKKSSNIFRQFQSWQTWINPLLSSVWKELWKRWWCKGGSTTFSLSAVQGPHWGLSKVVRILTSPWSVPMCCRPE